MIRVRSKTIRRKPENTIALINIVFLMLVFFLIAGALTPPMDARTTLIDTTEADPTRPPDALSIRADGTLIYHGEIITLEKRISELTNGNEEANPPTLRILPDRELPANDLLKIVGASRTLGIGSVLIVTERTLP